jgi:low temperature requirement protein LtrA
MSDREEEAERHATNLELFLDLVFVFAVTQIASSISHDLTWPGLGRGLLIAWLVWWQWSQYTWAGAAADLQREPWTRVLVLSTTPATLLVATAIPGAFTDKGAWFGVAFLVVQLLVLGMQGSMALRDQATRSSFIKYASVAAIMPMVVAIGGFLDGWARVVAWIVAGLLNVVGALRGGSGEWVINPVHFAERHALFIIISLGEALVAIGASASEAGLTASTAAGLVVAAAFACILWWSYFAYIPNVVEQQLRQAAPAQRAELARNLFTFGHFPLISGILFFAIAAKHMVLHPGDTLPTADRWLLAGSVVTLIGGYLSMQWQIARYLARERLAAIGAVVVLCAVSGRLVGAAVFGVIGVILLAAQSITWRRFRRGSLSHVSPNR